MEPDQFGGLSRFSGFSGFSGFSAERWRSSGLHPSQASRFIVDGALGFDQAYLHPRPAALLHPSLHARGGCGVGLAGFHSLCVWCLLPLFCCAAPSGLLVVGVGLWLNASWEIDARSFASFPAISRPVQSRPNFWGLLLGVPFYPAALSCVLPHFLNSYL